ncbi:MAG: MFS transporter [Xanthobacteraceae bacterium]|nr:MFS transporter [Xanthobacteraceae bacterium]
MQSKSVTPTRWSAVAALVLTGMVAAMQVGKASIALPLLQREFELSLFVAASAVGAYSLLGAVLGMPAGVLSSLFDPRRAAVTGLVVSALGSFIGAAASGGALLVGSRVIEGCGFLATVLAIPALLRAAAAPRDLDTVLPLWATYLPMGAAAMMLIAPAILPFGWRALWIGNGAVALAAAVVMSVLPLPQVAAKAPALRVASIGAGIGAVLRSKGALLLALIFALYTFQFMAMAGLLPVLLIERAGLSVSAAGVIAALTWVANAIGNASAGLLLRAGAPVWAVVAGAFAFMAVAAYGIFGGGLPIVVVALLASASLGLTGLVPGSVFAAAGRLATVSVGLVMTLGLVNQGSNIGSLLGPAAMGSLVQHFGWSGAWLLFAAVAACGIAAAAGLRAVLQANERQNVP